MRQAQSFTASVLVVKLHEQLLHVSVDLGTRNCWAQTGVHDAKQVSQVAFPSCLRRCLGQLRIRQLRRTCQRQSRTGLSQPNTSLQPDACPRQT
jgi:hypothetical protein